MTCIAKDAFGCSWPHCDCDVQTWPWMAKKHCIERAEWERRFHARVAECARDGDEGKPLSAVAAAEISAEEIGAWPEAGDPHNGPDWVVTLPEEAADEQMGNWLQDQEP